MTSGSALTFGTVLKSVNEQNFDHFKCAINIQSPANCSSDELALRQWGGSEITYNPSINVLAYTIPSLSIAEWGDPATIGVSVAPEYFFYS